MPTGYTQKIIDGEVKTAKDFLHLCLRNFGVCICMRDDEFKVENDYSKKIIDSFQESIDYHKQHLKYAEEWMKSIKEMSDDDLYQKYFQQKSQARENAKARLKETQRINDLMDKFICEIKDWDCSPEYENIKTFALDQLEKSKDNSDYSIKTLADTKDISKKSFNAEEYRQNLEKNAQWDIDYYTKEIKNIESKQAEVVSFYHFFKQELNKLK